MTLAGWIAVLLFGSTFLYLISNMVIWAMVDYYAARLEELEIEREDPILGKKPSQDKIDTLEQRLEFWSTLEQFMKPGSG
jgi:hypothetical protein